MDRTVKIAFGAMALVVTALCLIGLTSFIQAEFELPWWLAAVLACTLQGTLIYMVIGYATFNSPRVERNDGIPGGNA